MPRLPILEENLDLLKNNIHFSQKPKKKIASRNSKQFENLTPLLDKKCQAKCSWKLSNVFSEGKTSIFPKSSKFGSLECFEIL